MDSSRLGTSARSAQGRDAGDDEVTLEKYVSQAAITLDITYAQALQNSFERLRSMAEAKVKDRARRTLLMAQLIVIGIAGKSDDWQAMQSELIAQINE